MTLEELKDLDAHYRKLLEDTKKEVERLRHEIEISKAAVTSAKTDKKAAMLKGAEKAYTDAKNRIEMHTERIRNHEAKIIDLEQGHLIETGEFQKMLGELRQYSNKVSNESAADFMECVHVLEQVCADYEAKMKPVHKLGKLLQEDVYRAREQFDPEKIEPYSPLWYGVGNTFRSVAEVISAKNQPHSVNYGHIQKMASNALKARIAAGYPGLEDKARRYAAGDQDGRPWPKDQKDQAEEVLASE